MIALVFVAERVVLDMNCIEGLAFNQCAEQGGTFLGGGEVCTTVDCSDYLIPQSIGVELAANEEPYCG